MRAVCWEGKETIHVETVPDPVYFCKEQLRSLCDNSNPNAWMAEKLSGYSASGLFGYSHTHGGYPGGQAEYAGMPFADVGPLRVPDNLSDEEVLFLFTDSGNHLGSCPRVHRSAGSRGARREIPRWP
jgi:threonine dehydrogenase-like Zn-dependent dehydrogenase